MWWKRKEVKPVNLPDGFSVRRFNGTDLDIDLWIDITKNGLLPDDATHEHYIDKMINHLDLDINNILIIENNGVGVATITPIVHQNKLGYIHMVACIPAFRGLGIGNELMNIAMTFLFDAGCENVYLTTDDFRLPAIKSYITADFFPVLYDEPLEMEKRWIKIMNELHIDTIDMVDNEGNFVKVLSAC